MAGITSFQIVLLIIFVTFTVWINAKEIRDDQWNDNIPHSNKTVHWYNCTINGTVYYDDDCVGWIGKMLFYMGGVIFMIVLLFCCCFCYCVCSLCKICCFSERPREVIYATYVYPSTYNTPYSQMA